MKQVPILLLSDCPSQVSGLARITRDLATVIATMPEFRVATLGWMGRGRRALPFHTYHMSNAEFGELSLPQVWDDWAEGEPGIVLTIWDLSRLLWLAQPQFCEVDATREWLADARRRKFKLWSYVPVDSMGPHGRLTAMSAACLMGIDRVLAYTPFAEEVIRRTIGDVEADKRGITWLPHGLNTRIFQPRTVIGNEGNVISIANKGTGTAEGDVGAAPHVTRVGIVGTNQFRKDMGLAAAVMARLTEELKGNVSFWVHTDRETHYWSWPALIADFGLGEHVEFTYPPVDDVWMAEQYRRCDVTLHPGSEGFGYPIFESLACGVPAIHGDYAGGASIMRTCGLEDLLIQPRAWRLEGQFNCIRPVYDVEDWVRKTMAVLSMRKDGHDYAAHVAHLNWMKLGHVWKRYLREGLGDEQ